MRGYEVKLLSQEEATGEPDRWRDYETYLTIFEDGVKSRWYSDGMEPEDASFGRDLSWVPTELRLAYEKGLADGMALIRS